MPRGAIPTFVALVVGAFAHADEPIDIGSERQLFLDRVLVERLTGDADLVLQRPRPGKVVLDTDRPWEGNTCAYYTILEDHDDEGVLFRMYYRGSHFDETTRKAGHPEVTCYAESRDGLAWTRPELGLFEFDGSKANNIVWNGIGTHCFAPFRDENPGCPPDARYKAVARGRPLGEKGLYTFASPDGIHWRRTSDEPVVTVGAFDSQNIAFWDPVRRTYVCYHRGFRDGIRDVLTATSDDFVTWTKPEYLTYPGAPRQHLYTNAIRRYARAPSYLVGFPTRYLPDEGQRVEPILMSSRDGRTFHRWNEPLIPQSAPRDRAGNRSNYMARGLVQRPGDDRELSVYATEAYYSGPSSRLRRFTYRLDGFVALHAGAKGGEFVSKPFTFTGDALELNCAARGRVRVELQDAGGESIEGFTLADSVPLKGDEIAVPARWKGKASLGDLAGRAVRLRIAIEDGDVFSFRFHDESRTASVDPASPWARIARHFDPPAEIDGADAYRSPLLFADGTHVRTPEDWARRRSEILAAWTDRLGEWPSLDERPNVTLLETAERENFVQHRIRFDWAPGQSTTGYLLIPNGATADAPRPAVISVFYEPETGIGLGRENRDFALQLARRGFVTLSLGTTEATAARTYALYHPSVDDARVEPLSMLGRAAAQGWHVLARRPEVDAERIGIVGHSFGGKWAMFASCLFERFACAAWSDPGIVFDETRPSVNYWEPWYLGYHRPPWRKRGVVTEENPARGLYVRLRAEGRDLHELHALMAPRPFLVSGGSEDPPARWAALSHTVAVNRVLGVQGRVGMTNREGHSPTEESNAAIYDFFEHILGPVPPPEDS